MKASELRLGNLVLIDGKMEEVHSLELWCYDSESGVNGMISNYDCQDIKYPEILPIDITGELLLKFGFKETWGEFYYSGFSISKIYGAQWDVVDKGPLVPSLIAIIKYIHQLQNIYFALTDIELKFI